MEPLALHVVLGLGTVWTLGTGSSSSAWAPCGSSTALDARTLRGRVEARLWGPGRFGPALRRAVHDGRVRRVGRRTWAAVD